MASFWKLIRLGILSYALICLYVYIMQADMIFYPDIAGRNLLTSPNDINLAYRDVALKAADGTQLHGWFIPAKGAQATLLFFHGNAGNISHRLDSIQLFHTLKLNILIIDYRGYGNSHGKISEQGSYQDAEAAWSWLINSQGITADKIIIFGRSLGASIATRLASQHTPAALILESSFSSVGAMGQYLYPYLPIQLISHFQYDTIDNIKAVSCPVLVAHSLDDEIIPYSEGRKVFEASHEPKRFMQLRGGHNDGFMVTGPAYIREMGAFIRDSIRKPKT